MVDVTPFSGLDYSKATSTKSYVFLNQPKVLPAATDALTASTDFLETTDTLRSPYVYMQYMKDITFYYFLVNLHMYIHCTHIYIYIYIYCI